MKQVALASYTAVLVALGVFSAAISTAQQPQQTKSLQFEVAVIKPGNTQSIGASSYFPGGPGGQLRMVNTPLKQWVEMALSVREYALKAPPWLDTSRFDLVAKLPADKPFDSNTTGQMMKALLIERFGLKWHEESQIVSGYELVPDKKVLVQPATLLEKLRGSGGSSSGPSSVSGTNMSMAEFAGLLGSVLGRPIVDATHLSGGYDIKLAWRPSDDAEVASQRQYGNQYGIDVDNLPASASNALREQLGLRLQSAKVPSKIIVVDNINHQPTGN